MKKVLVTCHLGRHFRIFGHYDYKVLKKMGYEVHIAANFTQKIDNFEDEEVVKHQIDFDRNPFSMKNIKALMQLIKLFKKENFSFVHTQSPSGGVITRIASIIFRNKGFKVIYTPHGFHFYKGASLKNWVIFFPIEYLMSYFTDILIAINDEDYQFAKNKLKTKSVYKISGVGINLKKFFKCKKEEKEETKKKFGYQDLFVISYVGELSIRKNHTMIIESIKYLKDEIENYLVLFVGTGSMEENYKKLVQENELEEKIIFLGYRNDVDQIMKMSDLVLSASKQEGLPVNIMEAMATGIPIIASDCRGNRDLINNGENGFLVKINDSKMMSSKILECYKNKEVCDFFSKNNLELIKKYSVVNVEKEMQEIYRKVLGE